MPAWVAVASQAPPLCAHHAGLATTVKPMKMKKACSVYRITSKHPRPTNTTSHNMDSAKHVNCFFFGFAPVALERNSSHVTGATCYKGQEHMQTYDAWKNAEDVTQTQNGGTQATSSVSSGVRSLVEPSGQRIWSPVLHTALNIAMKHVQEPCQCRCSNAQMRYRRLQWLPLSRLPHFPKHLENPQLLLSAP